MHFGFVSPIRILVLTAALLLFASADAAKFKIATVAPDGSQWMQVLRGAAKEIKAATDGRVELKFYAGGVMGNDKKVLRKIRIGQLQGGAFTANGLSERYSDILIYGLPLIFDSQEEVDWVRGKMDKALIAGLDDAGFVSFGFTGGGFAKIMGDRPVAGLDDLRGRKIWVPEGDKVTYSAMSSLGLSPVVLPITDVLTGLQTGLLELIATPPVGAVILQWYTKTKYFTDLPIAYTMGMMAIDKRAFSRLNESDQAIFSEIMTRAYAELDLMGKQDNIDAEKALRANGLRFVVPDAESAAGLRTAAAKANDKMAADGLFSAERLHELLSYLKEYRENTSLAKALAETPE
jgi:TRAP-type C4-dicarboxylate transport system substrate-binding protein